ncbi:MAG TPA: hypothetical protein VFD48_12000 [Pyrinomonadaceae bacterium]|nr:hypothetical protein [Pyrinomonadaceae bacterium]
MASSDALFSLLYNGPLFILGLFWLFFRKDEYRRFQILRVLIDLAVFSIAIARFFGSSIPPSGHAILLTHTLITVSNRYYRLAALAMLITTAGLKISWHDFTSLGYGVVLGIISGVIWLWAGTDQILLSEEG